MSHLQNTANSHYLEWNIGQLSKICQTLCRNYCPDSILFSNSTLPATQAVQRATVILNPPV